MFWVSSRRARAHARRRQRGLGAGMTAAHHDYIEFVLEIHHSRPIQTADDYSPEEGVPCGASG